MTEDEHDHEPNGTTPLWVRLIYRYGVPAGIALFLTYFLTQQVAQDVDGLRSEMSERASEHRTQTFYLRAICLNTAQTETQRAACALPYEAR